LGSLPCGALRARVVDLESFISYLTQGGNPLGLFCTAVEAVFASSAIAA